MKFKHLYSVEAKVVVEVVLNIAANDEQEAFSRALDGAWHGVAPFWDKSKVTHIGEIKVIRDLGPIKEVEGY